MKHEKKIRISNFLIYSIYLSALTIILLLLPNIFNSGTGVLDKVYYFGYLFGILFILLLFIVLDLAKIQGYKYIFVLLCLLCLIVKLLWTLIYQIEPAGDYGNFYLFAQDLSKKFQLEGLGLTSYVALFPHIFGYSFFLSLFFYVFGPHVLIVTIINVILSVLSMCLIYYIVSNAISKIAAIIASIIWILYPSQTIFNMFVLSEPLYTTLILLFIALLTYYYLNMNTFSHIKILWFSFLMGIVLAIINSLRPLSLILIIALFIWSCVNGIEANLKNGIKTQLIFFSCILLFYFLFGSIINYYITIRLGQPLSSIPAYNIFVGFNTNTFGQYSQTDMDTLMNYKKNMTAPAAQGKMIEEVLARIRNNHYDLQFFITKLRVFLSYDRACVIYGESAISHVTFWSIISDLFHDSLLFFSFLGSIISMIKRESSIIMYVSLFFIGLTLAHMFIEVAARYHYSLSIFFTIMSAYSINYIIMLFKSFKIKQVFSDLQRLFIGKINKAKEIVNTDEK